MWENEAPETQSNRGDLATSPSLISTFIVLGFVYQVQEVHMMTVDVLC